MAEPSQPAPDDPEREMLAKLLAHLAASGSTGKYSPENLWALQGPPQFPAAVPPPGVERAPAYSGMPDAVTPMRIIDPGPGAALAAPTAPAHPRADKEFQPEGGKTDADQAPFHGRGSYALPETPKKNSKKGKR